MLDDLLDLAELAADLTGEVIPSLGGAAGKKRKKRPAPDPGRPAAQTKGKLTARRSKHQGEDPWDWKEEKPPWEL